MLFWRQWLLEYKARLADFESINAGRPVRWGVSKEELMAVESLAEEEKETLKEVRREMDPVERILRR